MEKEGGKGKKRRRKIRSRERGRQRSRRRRSCSPGPSCCRPPGAARLEALSCSRAVLLEVGPASVPYTALRLSAFPKGRGQQRGGDEQNTRVPNPGEKGC